MSAACNSKCYKIEIPPCPQDIRIEAAVAINKKYLAQIKDKFGKTYNSAAFSDNDGVLFINVSNFPEGYFNEYSGTMELTIIDKETKCAVELTFTSCDEEEDEVTTKCMTLQVTQIENYTEGFILWQDGEETGYLIQENGGKLKYQSDV